MRKYLNLFALLAFLLLTIHSHGQNVRDSSNSKILSTLNAFYKAYISEMSNAGIPDEKKLDEIKKKYCTPSLLKKLAKQEMDYDPFLNAQDSDINILKSISIKRNNQKDNQYLVSYIDSYSKKRILINLMMKNQNNNFKIDNVW